MLKSPILKAEIEAALGGAALRLSYQPQYHDEAGIIGVEALLRWLHPRYGLLDPGHFLHIAECEGLMPRLGGWAIRKACEQIIVWNETANLRGLPVSVNISATHLQQHDFVNQVLEILKQTTARPENLILELTESVHVTDLPRAHHHMTMLKERGVRFALDDFGTGYSSLASLQQLPFDQIKIDLSFVRGLPDDASCAAIVRAILALARDLRLTAIAEGVETKDQHEALRAMGCLNYQGYLFAAPMRPRDIPAFLHCPLGQHKG